MSQLKLLSNGRYHVVLTASGSGRSEWNDLAVTRWREDATLDSWGSFLFMRCDTDGGVWSAFDAAAFGVRGLRATVEVAVAGNEDVELRRLRITNGSQRLAELSATSYTELVLAPSATDAAHPAFNKLFVVTEIDRRSGVILATRRPSAPTDGRAWLFHQAVVHGESGDASFETDRMRFIGRGRHTSNADALRTAGPLGGHDGAVLDPIAALRVPFHLPPGAACTIDWTTGIAATRDECIALAGRSREAGAGDCIVEGSHDFRRDTLRRLAANEDDAALFERLAAALLVADPAMRAPAGEIAKNRHGQSSLWAFGISGDVPIVVTEVASAHNLSTLRQLLQAHGFWTAHGLKTELMVLQAGTGNAASALRESIRAVIDEVADTTLVDQHGGIFVRDAAALGDADRVLLHSVARIVVPGALRSLADLGEAHGARVAPAASRVAEALEGRDEPLPPPDSALLAFNGHGGFSADGCEYVITTSRSCMTPLPWTNVIANPGFGTIVSESGSASTWSENSHELRLTPWSNDPVSDPCTEAIYIRDDDSEAFWSPTVLPTRSAGAYVVRHGFGYSVFEHAELEIESTLRIHVAIDAPVKYSTLTLRNRSDRMRRLSVTGYVEWVLGDEREKSLMHVVTELDAARSAVFARNGYNADFAERMAFLAVDGGASSVCGDRGDFFGAGGTRAAPAALAQACLSGRVGAGLDPCGALRVDFELAAGEEREIVFRLGAGKTFDEARELAHTSAGQAATSLDAVHAHWRRTLGTVRVRTPVPEVDVLANGWLLYQVIGSRLWGRTAFYQASGAYGFRDQLQDVMALVHAEPGLVREHLLRCAARQFEEGDVQHWWHPPSGKGVRTRCSDDYLWLPFVTSRYVEVTGDIGILDEVCPFLQSRPLAEGEVSNYEQPAISSQSATLYEHCARALQRSRRRGSHGLPLMGGGDWNDGMNLVGIDGKGESVWLAFFLIAVLKRFAPLAQARDDAALAALCEGDAAMLKAKVEASAWDGAWYQRAWFDDGTPLGSAANIECQIDSIAQSWSVISGAAPPEHARTAMASLEHRLVRPEARIVQLLDPPFDVSRPSPGYIQGYVPGVRENGGQYTHAAVWVAIAFAAMGDAERAWQLFAMLNPIRHADSVEHVAVYKTEPYVVAGDVYA
ncbi:MAG: cyclic beta 1-2 glucan synthetase, partial [Pseudomonadota bacterium]|nr:cyclic beta 1-2 glucan synthetase [Pseudomonadota bacterium]